MKDKFTHTLEARDLVVDALTLHRIDHSLNSVSSVDCNSEQKELSEYLKKLISDVSTNTKGRKFKLRAHDTQVINAALSALQKNDFKGFHNSAKRLLDQEIKAQTRVERMGTEIFGGMLLQAFIVDRGVKKVVICKAEISDYLNEQSFKRASGYPLKRRIYRSAQVVFNSKGEVSEVLVFDSSAKGAKYWWDGYLELDQHWDDAYNTRQAFEMIDRKVLASLKKSSPADHMALRNATIRYFRNNGSFDLEDFLEKVIGDYTPVDSSLQVEELKARIRVLPEKNDFDAQFELVPSEITARIKTVVALTDNIDLIIKREIDIKRYITSELIHKQKYIRIRTDEGYEAFLDNSSSKSE